MDTTTPSVESRLHRLEKTNARWRAGAIAGLAGSIGLLIGGMGQPQQTGEQRPYGYVAIGDTIYSIDQRGNIGYINLGGAPRTAEGYFSWGRVKIDRARELIDRP